MMLREKLIGIYIAGRWWIIGRRSNRPDLPCSEERTVQCLDVSGTNVFVYFKDGVRLEALFSSAVVMRRLVDDSTPPQRADWREAELDELLGERVPGDDKPHIPVGILKRLARNSTPIVTLGDLTDWINEKGNFWHKDIPGLGMVAAHKITAATDVFWTARKEAIRLAEDNADDGEEGGDTDGG